MLLFPAVMLCTLLLSACASAQKDSIAFDQGTYASKDWSETAGTYAGAAVPDKETAIGIAEAVFKGMEKSAEVQEYVPQSVFYDEQDEIWIVSFWKESEDFTLGGDCSIAIQKADGRVMRIWFGE